MWYGLYRVTSDKYFLRDKHSLLQVKWCPLTPHVHEFEKAKDYREDVELEVHEVEVNQLSLVT